MTTIYTTAVTKNKSYANKLARETGGFVSSGPIKLKGKIVYGYAVSTTKKPTVIKKKKRKAQSYGFGCSFGNASFYS